MVKNFLYKKKKKEREISEVKSRSELLKNTGLK